MENQKTMYKYLLILISLLFIQNTVSADSNDNIKRWSFNYFETQWYILTYQDSILNEVIDWTDSLQEEGKNYFIEVASSSNANRTYGNQQNLGFIVSDYMKTRKGVASSQINAIQYDDPKVVDDQEVIVTVYIFEQTKSNASEVVVKVDDVFSRAHFSYEKGQNIRVKTKNGTEFFIPSKAIRTFAPRLNMIVSLEDFITPTAIMNKGIMARSGARMIRAGGAAILNLKSVKGYFSFDGCINAFIPSPKFKDVEFYSTKKKITRKQKWRKVRDKISYDEAKKGYHLEYCGLSLGILGFCIGETTKERVYLRIRRKSTKMYVNHLYVIFPDSTIAYCLPYRGRKRKSAYLIPIYPHLTGQLVSKPTKKNKYLYNYSRGSEIYAINSPLNLKFNSNGTLKNTKKRKVGYRKMNIVKGLKPKFVLVDYIPAIRMYK